VDPRAGLYTVAKRKIPTIDPTGNWIPVIQLVF
jgi:hypothetical protein